MKLAWVLLAFGLGVASADIVNGAAAYAQRMSAALMADGRGE